jgi:dTDP-L-rhamnose 4-epimerase
MKILISGGAGFIGSALSLALVARGHEVTVLDNLSPQIHGEDSSLLSSIRDKVRFIRGDVRSRTDWQLALAGQEAVVHLAAETGTGQSMYQIAHYSDVNIGGTALLLDVLANESHQVRRLVVASSRAIYGEGRYRCARCGIVHPLSRVAEDMSRGDFEVKCPECRADVELMATDERSQVHPSSIYGISKHTQEQMVLAAGQALGIPAISFRYQNVYGPGQSLTNPYTGILSIFSTRILNGHGILVFEDGRESRDFVYISDVVSATMAGIEHSGVTGEVYNVGSGVATDVETVARTLVRAYGANVPVTISGNFRVGDIRHNVADLGKVKAELGFTPMVSFEQGIAEFAAWVKRQASPTDRYDDSIREMKSRGLYR